MIDVARLKQANVPSGICWGGFSQNIEKTMLALLLQKQLRRDRRIIRKEMGEYKSEYRLGVP